MLARAHAFTVDGLHARHVMVEVDVRPGLPGFAIVGLADAAVREARERVRAAILNSGFEFPARRITANLAPADLPKAGPGLDLALACALLAATGQIAGEGLQSHALLGELGLDGAVRRGGSTLAVADAARRAGLRGLVVSPPGAHEAGLIEGLHVAAASSLRSAARVLNGGAGDPVPASAALERTGTAEPALEEVRGQHHAVRALVIAAAGAHNVMLSGPPGTGKTMLALRMPSILPPLSTAEAVEVTRIHSLGGARVVGLRSRRPFRAPHHTVTAAGLVGGARGGVLGEAVLAHNGVLFLDEISEFARSAIQALRQPLEEGRIAIARARYAAVYPARFILIAATNPCPCGYAGGERCTCSESELARQRRRLSGPLLERIDLVAHMREPGTAGADAPPLSSSALAREQVAAARERQASRLAREPESLNGHLGPSALARHLLAEPRAEEMVRHAAEAGLLSARGAHRVMRVARTIADLGASERVRTQDVGAALALRPEAALA